MGLEGSSWSYWPLDRPLPAPYLLTQRSAVSNMTTNLFDYILTVLVPCADMTHLEINGVVRLGYRPPWPSNLITFSYSCSHNHFSIFNNTSHTL